MGEGELRFAALEEGDYVEVLVRVIGGVGEQQCVALLRLSLNSGDPARRNEVGHYGLDVGNVERIEEDSQMNHRFLLSEAEDVKEHAHVSIHLVNPCYLHTRARYKRYYLSCEARMKVLLKSSIYRRQNPRESGVHVRAIDEV